MKIEIWAALLLPLLGTTVGAALVFFLRGELKNSLQRLLSGFAAGVMVAASVWSLLIPAMEASAHMNKLAFLPAFLGVWAGFGFLMLLDKLIPHLHRNATTPEGAKSNLGRHAMLTLAVALHNLPEGMAVGVVIAGWLGGSEIVSAAGALALAAGIALQNLPEGAIISLPLHAGGASRKAAFGYGFLSGIIEPIGAVLTLLLATWITPALPFLLAFAAGAMLYVVVEELIPEMAEGGHSHIGPLAFAAGFTLMMALDVALG